MQTEFFATNAANIHHVSLDIFLYESEWKKFPSIDENKVVYRFRNLIIKKLTSCDDCLKYEFKVGGMLNEIGFPYFPLVYFYTKYGNEAYLVTEYIEGTPLSDFSEDRIILQVLFTIADIQSRIKFTHYDLNKSNIIIQNLGTKQRRTYNCFGKIYTIDTYYEVKIIDFGYSHLEGLTNSYYESTIGAIAGGAIASVFDDLMDLSKVYTDYINDCILKDNESTTKFENAVRMLKMNNMIYPEILGPNPHEDDPAYESKLIARFELEGREFFFLYNDQNPGPGVVKFPHIDDIFAYNIRYYNTNAKATMTLMDIEALLPKNSENLSIEDKQSLADKYVVAFGAACHKYKSEMLNARIIPTNTIFEAMITSIM